MFGFFTPLAPVHKSLVAHQAVRDCGFVQLNHIQCRPRSQCILSVQKSAMSSSQNRFADDESFKAVVEAWFEGQEDRYKQLS